MLNTTKGIVLKTIKYGETSLISTIFTERFGLQSYILKGFRSTRAKNRKAQLFFPSSLLDMVVYHNPQKNLQFIKEFQPEYFYKSIGESIIKNRISLFSMEVLLQLLMPDDVQEDLYCFCSSFLQQLDALEIHQSANLPMYFLIQSGKLTGYHFLGHFSDQTPFLDLSEGRFSDKEPIYPPFIEHADAALMSLLNSTNEIKALADIKMDSETRKRILNYFLHFFETHIPRFRNIKSAAILSTILN